MYPQRKWTVITVSETKLSDISKVTETQILLSGRVLLHPFFDLRWPPLLRLFPKTRSGVRWTQKEFPLLSGKRTPEWEGFTLLPVGERVPDERTLISLGVWTGTDSRMDPVPWKAKFCQGLFNPTRPVGGQNKTLTTNCRTSSETSLDCNNHLYVGRMFSPRSPRLILPFFVTSEQLGK